MATTVEELEANIRSAAAPGFRGRLLARGQARAMIWRGGVLPPDAPAFSDLLSYDLHSYGYAMLGLGLRLRDMEGSHDLARLAFEQAATALESVVAKCDPADRDRDFHHIMAATAYHLGRFSARAYSLLARVQAEGNFSPLERALCLLILRNLDELERLVLTGRLDGMGSDASLVTYFEQQWQAREVAGLGDGDADGFALKGLDRALTERFFAAISLFLFALERGEPELVEQSKGLLREGYIVCADLNLVPQCGLTGLRSTSLMTCGRPVSMKDCL